MSRNRLTIRALPCLFCVLLAGNLPGTALCQESDPGSLAAAQVTSAGEPHVSTARSGPRWSIDLAALMVAPAIAWPVGSEWRVGGGIGVGDDLFGFMAVGGRHYAEPGWWSYEETDGATGKSLFDVVHARVFARWEPSASWHLDLGLQGAAFLHFDSSDDDPGGGVSATVYVLPMYGWPRVKFGPRIAAGHFRGCNGAAEFGVKVSPLIVRVLFN